MRLSQWRTTDCISPAFLVRVPGKNSTEARKHFKLGLGEWEILSHLALDLFLARYSIFVS